MLKAIINGKELKEKTEITLALKYDAVASTFSLSTAFNPNDSELKKLFKPLSYQEVEIYEGEYKLFTGTVTSTTIGSEANPKGVTIAGYSKTGVLMDCEMPAEVYPLQFEGKTVKAIIESILDPFGLELFVNQNAKEDANKIVDKITAENTDKCATFITKLASQYNIIVGHTRNGRLLLTRNRTGEKALSNYQQGKGDYNKASLNVDGQQLFNRYTVIRQATVDGTENNNSEQTVTNKIVKPFRPTVRKQSNGDEKNTENAAKALRAKSYGAITVNLELGTHRYQDNSVIKPNRTVTIVSPDIYITEKTRIFVRDVTLKSDANGDIATLNCVLPESLTGEAVTHIFN